ncbi:hypothetical protein BCR44DRAFT_51446 [Catenaria anguillulae PL171]|uniref:Uncharacterized protein n=1 Tax=Catenaria anguillulae PL171 TaxID=765915 RepID=A0A1Y2HR65_9FUNG|nr:hypothetical protein BCR44DRAFT_51446 [Catenaria anguillulae PL171]
MSESGDTLGDDGSDSCDDEKERMSGDYFFGSADLLFGRGGARGHSGDSSNNNNNNNNSHLMGGGRIPIISEDDYNSDYSDIDPESTPGQIGVLFKNAVEHVGEFTFEGASQLPSRPGPEAEGYGPVTVPLVDPLAACGSVAPFGRGVETVVDPEVRRTWRFGASHARNANTAWDTGLAQLVATVADRLGCPGMPLECHLYKLLLYWPGCHCGGELVVYQPDGSALTRDFGAADGTNAFSPHFALHYADAELNLSLLGRYCLALVYSICWPEGHEQIDLLQSLSAQRQLAAQLGAHIDSFSYIFEHPCTPASIGKRRLKALKGKDRARANMIDAANKLLPKADRFVFSLVRGERVVSTGPEDRGSGMQFPTWIHVESGKQFPTRSRPASFPFMKKGLAMWKVIAPCLIPAIPRAVRFITVFLEKSNDLFRNMLQLAVHATVAGVDQAIKDVLVKVVDAIDVADMLSFNYTLYKAAEHPRAWAQLHAKVLEAISTASKSHDAFNCGVSVITSGYGLRFGLTQD